MNGSGGSLTPENSHLTQGLQRGKDGANLRPEFWKESARDIPDQLDIHPQVIMDHLVPRARNLPPRDVGIGSAEVFRKVLDGFTDDLDSPKDRVLDLLPLLESSQVEAGDVVFDEIDALQDMGQIN